MKRSIEKHLQSWQQEPTRLPLLIRGARQVGKSFTIEKFGREFFENCVTINFDLYPHYSQCFEGDLDPFRIIETLSVIARTDIFPGKTLLFLDEIQQCPRAIMALRYFYEKLPTLHVIGAGSLLEFALAAENLRMPVGRVQYLFMYPLTFYEFLDATGEHRARESIASHEQAIPFPEALHNHLLSLLKRYCLVGGMPAVVQDYINNKNLNHCQRLLAAISQTYRDDFGKYAKQVKIPLLQKLFHAVPKMVGRKFKYSAVDETLPSRDLKQALDLLEKAGVVYRVRQTSGDGLPLEAGASDRNFKVIFLDVGLMQSICGVYGEIVSAADILAVHAGAVAEQFVGQELVANLDPYIHPGLYYWAREARTSNAEVDYLVPYGSQVFPLEVKAGKSGTLRSIQLFLEQYQLPWGIKVSQANLKIERPFLAVPLYALEKLPSFLKKSL
jgi:predicted AAA+ superfamily ATPase